MPKIATVIITFNRLAFLKEIIQAVRIQSRKPDAIIIINNSSSDGTEEWLSYENELIVIKQPNVGSSGGQYTGFKEAFDRGFDYVWTMDDDVVPATNCLETLLKYSDDNTIVTPLRFSTDGSPFLNDAINYNLTNPLSSIWKDIYNSDNYKEEYTEAVGITFEGPLIHRNIIERIGFPEFNFFIYGDDTEYFIRAWRAGCKIRIINQARMNRKLPAPDLKANWSWKNYYIIRNIIAIDKIHGNLAVRIIRPFGYLLKWILRAKSFNDIGTVFKAFVDGYFYKKTSIRK